ncbi:MAG: DUF4390 domain-containing protein [Nitrospiraceae bacterium]|nr:MAG: DUF4390 domain-containing protein [Nitrospiraceae bacterium]
MKNVLILLTSFMIFLIAASGGAATGPEIIGPHLNILDNNIIVNTHVKNVAELESHIKSGVDKAVIFTIELLRVWMFWPDEFVVSKRIERVVRYDNLRDQFLVSSFDGITRSDRYFADYEPAKDWIFTVRDVNLAHVKELDPGTYYIRIVLESKSLEQLPLIGFLMHVIPEVEMSLARESEPFLIRYN